MYLYSYKQRTTHHEFPVIRRNRSKTAGDLDESPGAKQWIVLFIIKYILVHEACNPVRVRMALPKEVSWNCLLNLLELHSIHRPKESSVVGWNWELKTINQLECWSYGHARASCKQVLWWCFDCLQRCQRLQYLVKRDTTSTKEGISGIK